MKVVLISSSTLPASRSGPACVAGAVRQAGHEVSVYESLSAVDLLAYDLFDMAQYAQHNITPAVLTKRGCAFGCTYCSYSKLEGMRYRLDRRNGC